MRCVATFLQELVDYTLFIQLSNGRDSMLLPPEEWDCQLGIFCVENSSFVLFDFTLLPSLDPFSTFLLVFRLRTLGLLASEQRDNTNSARRSTEELLRLP